MWWFQVGDYVYLQHEALTTMDIKVRCTIFQIKNVLLSDVLLLEGKDGQEWKDNPNNCTPCHLPIKGISDLELAMVPIGYKCTICGEKNVQQQCCCVIFVKKVGKWRVITTSGDISKR